MALSCPTIRHLRYKELRGCGCPVGRCSFEIQTRTCHQQDAPKIQTRRLFFPPILSKTPLFLLNSFYAGSASGIAIRGCYEDI